MSIGTGLNQGSFDATEGPVLIDVSYGLPARDVPVMNFMLYRLLLHLQSHLQNLSLTILHIIITKKTCFKISFLTLASFSKIPFSQISMPSSSD